MLGPPVITSPFVSRKVLPATWLVTFKSGARLNVTPVPCLLRTRLPSLLLRSTVSPGPTLLLSIPFTVRLSLTRLFETAKSCLPLTASVEVAVTAPSATWRIFRMTRVNSKHCHMLGPPVITSPFVSRKVLPATRLVTFKSGARLNVTPVPCLLRTRLPSLLLRSTMSPGATTTAFIHSVHRQAPA